MNKSDSIDDDHILHYIVVYYLLMEAKHHGLYTRWKVSLNLLKSTNSLSLFKSLGISEAMFQMAGIPKLNIHKDNTIAVV